MGETVKIERIVVDPKIHFGKPCIAGTRIPVENVLELINAGLTFDEIIRDYYPDLAVEDLQTCYEWGVSMVEA